MKSRVVPNRQELTCALCKGSFLSSEIMLERRTHICGIEDTFYNCPLCGHEYLILQTDEEIRELMRRRDEMAGFATLPDAVERAAEYSALDAEIKQKLNELNGKRP